MNPEFSNLRPLATSTKAMVVSGHHLATIAGVRALIQGGNAFDAAVTAAAVLAVVRPHMCSLGGDMFALAYPAAEGRVVALNGSGRAGGRATLAEFAARGLSQVPDVGINSVTVPGAVDGWATLLTRYGTFSWEQALTPALAYARAGYVMYTTLSAAIASPGFKRQANGAALETYRPGGQVPQLGDVFVSADLAQSIETLARRGPRDFYEGEIALRLANFFEREGGLITADDLATHTSTWQEPLQTTYHGHTVFGQPPSTQGIALLMQLNLLESFDLAGMGHNSAQYIHTLLEARKLAFADRDKYVSDPEFVDVPIARLLSKEYAAERRRLIDPDRAASSYLPGAFPAGDGDTTYLAVVDEAGNAVSLIESLFNSFGSCLMVDGTGMMLQNRGALFSLDPAHANRVEPGKRTYHTLNPAMMFRDGQFEAVLGTPGGDGQTQTLTIVINNLLVFDMNVQAAIEAPRWRGFEGARVAIERRIPEAVRAELSLRGHIVESIDEWSPESGDAKAILRDLNSGALMGGADMRRDAFAIGL